MAPRTERTTIIPSGVASPVTMDHAAKGSVFVNSRNAGNSKTLALENEERGGTWNFEMMADLGMPGARSTAHTMALRTQPYTLFPQPYTLLPQHSTLHPTPSTLHSQPSTLNPAPYTLNPQPCSINTQPDTIPPQHSTLSTLHPTPYTPHLKL